MVNQGKMMMGSLYKQKIGYIQKIDKNGLL